MLWPWLSPKPEPPLMQDLTLKRGKQEAARMWNDTKTRNQLFGIAGAVVTTCLLVRFATVRCFPRVANAEAVTPDMLGGKKWLRGYVTRVGDSDNFRLFHTPGFGWGWLRRIPKNEADLSGETIHIRMAGIDAPETGFSGHEPQPGATKALAWLKKQVEGKFVYCQLLHRDQYGRIVAAVHRKPSAVPRILFTGSNVNAGNSLSLLMLRAGLATVYEQQDAAYGEFTLSRFKSAEKEAQKYKRGIWKNGTDIETPAQFKSRVREAQAKKGELVSPMSTADDTARCTQ